MSRHARVGRLTQLLLLSQVDPSFKNAAADAAAAASGKKRKAPAKGKSKAKKKKDA